MFKINFKFRKNEWTLTDFESKEKAEEFSKIVSMAINDWGDGKELLIFEILEM